DRLVQPQVAGRTVAGPITEGEDAAVAGDQPVAGAVVGAGHADDGLVEAQVAGRAVAAGGAEGEDAAVAGEKPEALELGAGAQPADHRQAVAVGHRGALDGQPGAAGGAAVVPVLLDDVDEAGTGAGDHGDVAGGAEP